MPHLRPSVAARFVVPLLVAAIAALAVAASTSWASPQDVPTPTVTGPIANGPGPKDHAFIAEDPARLARYGYVEREYYVTGDAFTYSGTSGLTTGTKVTTGGPGGNGAFPYKTRIVVRRPARAEDFNGTTVLEWYNVTAGFDVEWNWFNDPDYMMRHGYAWVGVSAQRVGITYLKGWNAARYGDLDVTSTATTDAMSYDIFGAVAKALRGFGAGRDPMGGLQTERIIASGESQSGGRLNTYYNAIQPLHELIDSFLITVAGGTLRDDRPQTKAIRVLSERENTTAPAPGADPDTSGYRRWEVPGSSHLPFQAYVNFAPLSARDTGGGVADCVKPPLSRVAWPYVYNRAIDALVEWQAHGTAPPIAPRHQYSGSAVARDQYGIAMGGIRLPDADVPTATNTAVNSAQPGATGFSLFCGLLGSWEPFDADLLNGLYTDYGDYVDKVAPSAEAVGATGFVNAEGVAGLKADAARFTRLRPSAPALGEGSDALNAGAFDLTWRGPSGPETQTTYELQHRSSAAGAGWTTVSGADELSARSFAFTGAAPEAEGTYAYRVRGTTLVPALYPNPEYLETTPFSEELGSIKVDRTAPGAPATATDRAPEYAGDGGWFKDTVTVSFTGSPDPALADGSAGSGLDPATVPAPVTRSQSGSFTISGTTRDLAGNTSDPGTRTVQVDATAPALSVTCPVGVFVGDQAHATVTASDAESGLAQDPSGTPAVDTAGPGTRTVTATAIDSVGHSTTRSCTVLVRPLPAGGANGPKGEPGPKGDRGPAGPPGASGGAPKGAKVACRKAANRRVVCSVSQVPRGASVRLVLRRDGRIVAQRVVTRGGSVTLRAGAARGRHVLRVSVRTANGRSKVLLRRGIRL